MILLDTCTLLWLASDQNRLSRNAKAAISKHAGELFISSISAFEIALKSRKGNIQLPLPSSEWVLEALKHHGIQELPVDSLISIKSVELPLLHNDPCDRFIIASAIQNSMAIVTCDPLIAQYKDVEVIW
jgi:PIN domain nuclease of toxin-antitoxin system